MWGYDDDTDSGFFFFFSKNPLCQSVTNSLLTGSQWTGWQLTGCGKCHEEIGCVQMSMMRQTRLFSFTNTNVIYWKGQQMQCAHYSKRKYNLTRLQQQTIHTQNSSAALQVIWSLQMKDFPVTHIPLTSGIDARPPTITALTSVTSNPNGLNNWSIIALLHPSLSDAEAAGWKLPLTLTFRLVWSLHRGWHDWL